MATLVPLGLLAFAETPAEQLVKPEPGLWLWTFVIFIGLLVVLWKFGWGTMIANLDKRDAAIRGAVEAAKREREEAERLLAEGRDLAARVRREGTELLAQATADAARERQKLIDQARGEYDQIVARGREQLEQETRAAVAQIRKNVADLAINVASRLVDKSLDTPTHRELAEKFTTELESRANRS